MSSCHRQRHSVHYLTAMNNMVAVVLHDTPAWNFRNASSYALCIWLFANLRSMIYNTMDMSFVLIIIVLFENRSTVSIPFSLCFFLVARTTNQHFHYPYITINTQVSYVSLQPPHGQVSKVKCQGSKCGRHFTALRYMH